MAEDNIVQKIKRWKPMSESPIERPKTRWKDGVLEGIKSVNMGNWKKVAQNGDSWKKVVEQARNFVQVVALYENNKTLCWQSSSATRGVLHSTTKRT